GERFHEVIGIGTPTEQEAKCVLITRVFGLDQLLAAGAEACAAVEVGGPLPAPRLGRGWPPRPPSLGGVKLAEIGRNWFFSRSPRSYEPFTIGTRPVGACNITS